MATKETAERACKEPNPIIDGRKANVNLAILGAKPRGNVTCTGWFPTVLQPSVSNTNSKHWRLRLASFLAQVYTNRFSFGGSFVSDCLS